MKVKVIANAFYNLTYLKPDMIIDFKGSKLPSWAVPVKAQKTEKKSNELLDDYNATSKILEGDTPEKTEKKQNEPLDNVGQDNSDEVKTPENTEQERTEKLDNVGQDNSESENNELIPDGNAQTPELDTANRLNAMFDYEKEEYLNKLLDKAMEKGILIDDLDKKSIEAAINELEEALREGD